ncbi:MAG TPA: TonB-dependent receptor [Chitinophagaceae bacterium]|nr:TonB-dependent receptor [Chitinophagaceae bacterium]
MKKSLFILFLLLSAGAAYAQSTNYNGIVSDEKGNPLGSAVIIIKNSKTKVLTSTSGEFSVTAEKGAILEVSFTGFDKASIKLGNETTLSIKLVYTVSAIEEVVVTGTRGLPRSKIESTVPVDVHDVKTLVTELPQTNITDILNNIAPSFNSTTQTVADGTDHVDPATVRGLGPDQTLVLVNGKRRYTSALVNVNGTMGRGSVGTDLNAIAAAGIDRIELLRDGAAAQYGSDAIAGVINVQLNRDINKGRAIVSYGANSTAYESFTHANSGNFPQGVNPNYIKNWATDGHKLAASVNYGFQIGKTKESFINLTVNYDQREPTVRSGERTGDLDNRASGDGASNALLTQFGVTRNFFQMRVGQSRTKNIQGIINGAVKTKGSSEFYFFSILGNRKGNSTGFYRMPYQSTNIPAIYPRGFLPEISSTINDISFGTGLKGKLGTWNYDLSNVYGQNEFSFFIENTLNVSAWYNNGSTQTEFNAGKLSFRQNTTNFDLTKNLKDKWKTNLAFGAEFRYENYRQEQGEEASWGNYMRRTNGQVDLINGTPTTVRLADNSTGIPAGGSQVFPGFRPDNSLNEHRTSVALYSDIEIEPTTNFLLDGALRFENYSDFGSNLSWKLSGRYKVSNAFSIRGSSSTGFRAPALQQRFLTKTSTVFQGGIAFDDATLPNNSKAAELLGIPSLRPEISQSFSLGATFKSRNFSMTVDGFTTKVTDRIILTDAFQGRNGGNAQEQEIYNILLLNNASRGVFMANATDLRTSGVDLILSYNFRFSNKRSLKLESASTFTEREILGKTKVSAKLAGRESTYMSPINKATLVDGNPKIKSSFLASYRSGKFNMSLRNTYFGKVTHVEGGGATNWFFIQELEGKVVTDLTVGYKINNTLRVSAGANNLFDIYADKLIASKGSYKRLDVTVGSPTYDQFVETRTAAERNVVTNNAVTSNNQFNYSRRVTQIGMNGRYLFLRVQIDF